MIVYDDTEPLEKFKIYDARVEVPPHYDTFAEFTYSYHYGDAYIPYIKQDEPLKLECQHFVDCIRSGETPMTDGQLGPGSGPHSGAAGMSLQQQRHLRFLFPGRVPPSRAESFGKTERQRQWQWPRRPLPDASTSQLSPRE